MTSSNAVVLAGAVFLASAVEMVEALTIVVAVGHTEGWRAALRGLAVALVTLAVLVAAVGPALAHFPLVALRLVVGSVLFIFGLQWLRKAILRASGLQAKRDEDAVYRQTVASLETDAETHQRARVAFVLSFKGVFLEGLEVVIIVLTLGSSAGRLGLAVLAAIAALVVVGLAGVIVARQLSNVPENLMKMVVGVLLVSYGTFFTGEGLKVRWPGGDVALVVVAGAYGIVACLTVIGLRSSARRHPEGATSP